MVEFNKSHDRSMIPRHLLLKQRKREVKEVQIHELGIIAVGNSRKGVANIALTILIVIVVA